MVAQHDPEPPAIPRIPKGPVNPERWKAILDAAGEVFNDKGYQAARIEDIAARVGILRGSLYYYIESKEDLLYALSVAAHTTGVATLAEDDVIRRADAPTRLGAFIARWMAMVPTHPHYAPTAARETWRLSDERRAQLIEMRHQMHDYVRGLIDQGIADGDFDPSVDPGVVTNSLFELLNGTIHWFRPTGAVSCHDVGVYYQKLVLRGLRAPSSE